MKILGKCLWHKWDYTSEHFYNDTCIWSNGTRYFRTCKCCGKKQKKLFKDDKWRDING